jgi:hypothetical protein
MQTVKLIANSALALNPGRVEPGQTFDLALEQAQHLVKSGTCDLVDVPEKIEVRLRVEVTEVEGPSTIQQLYPGDRTRLEAESAMRQIRKGFAELAEPIVGGVRLVAKEALGLNRPGYSTSRVLEVGEIFELPPDEAAELVARGQAERWLPPPAA